MIWIALGMVTFVAMLPLAVAIERRPRGPGRREAALALHHAQLAEAEKDLATGASVASERLGAVTDVQRRILASVDEREVELTDGARTPLLAALACVPLIALALYLASGSPGLPV